PVSGLAAANSSPTTISGSTAFTATITGGTNVTYAWNFGDGQTGSGATATHTYAAVGMYTATVTATNSAGSVTAQTVASVHDVPISGLSLYNSSPVIVGTTVMFSATISAGTNVTYTWNFGDGTSVVSTGTTPAVSHVFNTVNTFNVSVTATNAEGSQTVFTVVVVQPYKVYLPGVFR
ncbi:MAG: PKD domain-containing protein, partial [Chloroflexi bacterium]|nr:PKD domain-containing protein [Chloroflexota bacterium]